MKTIITSLISICAVCSMMAQSTRFIEPNKSWRVLEFTHKQFVFNSYQEGPAREYDLSFQENSDTIINGVQYYKLTCQEELDKRDGEIVAIMREENGKVYFWNEGKECLMYDFSLNEGDETEVTDMYGTHSCKVDKVSYTTINGKQLKVLYVSTDFVYDDQIDDGMPQHIDSHAKWIEGVGTTGSPLFCFEDPMMTGSVMRLVAYTETEDSAYFPFSFHLPDFSGQQLVLGEDVTSSIPNEEWGKDNLTYEFDTNNNLHVCGTMWSSYTPHQYIYCTCKQLDNLNEYAIDFVVDEIEPASNTLGAHKVDLYFPFYAHEGKYFIKDKAGEHVIYLGTADIHSTKENSISHTAIYDLSGRRLSKAPKNGLYIKDGKMYNK